MMEETVRTSRYFTTLEYFLARYDRFGRRMAFRADTAEGCLAWQHELRAKLRSILGMDTMLSCGLEPVTTEGEVLDGYVRERVELRTEPGVVMPLYVLLPAELRPGERRAVVMAPHGHVSGGKLAPAGRRDVPAVAEVVEKYHYDYGVQLVREGFVVLVPDARGFGERREWTEQGDAVNRFMSNSCYMLSHITIPLGQTITGMWTWDLMRLIDYAAQRADCDPERIGCAGLSGGGLQTLWVSALDERVRCAVVSGYFYGYRDSLLKLGGCCSCNYVPHLWELADMGDIGALIAPRPFLIETGDQDECNGERGVVNATEQVEIARKAYSLLSAPDRISHHVFPGPHRWNGTRAIPWLKRWLLGEGVEGRR